MASFFQHQGTANDPPLAVEPLDIAVVGAGYVGVVTGAGLASFGHRVRLVDRSPDIVARLNRGRAGFHEPGLDDLLVAAIGCGRILATTDLAAAVQQSDVTFICVGTPPGQDGACDLAHVREAAFEIGGALAGSTRPHTVVTKSTVPPCTTRDVVRPAVTGQSGRRDIAVAANPEFLREGSAVRDFLNPDRIVIGADSPDDGAALERLYAPFSCPVVRCDCATAEMIKYASNAMLAVRISAANEIGSLCKPLGIDANAVLAAVGMDRRIGSSFLRAGLGFGGSCLPKDVRALAALGRARDRPMWILEMALAVNEAQTQSLLELVRRRLSGFSGKRIAVLGLAFKPGTDDVRESIAISVVRGLYARGAEVVAYDPMAMERFSESAPFIEYAASAEQAMRGSDAVVIVTEWPEFEEIDYTGCTVIDGRGCAAARATARVYEGLCW